MRRRFVAKVTAGGAGAASPTRVDLATDQVLPGGTVGASWALPNPTPGDYLLLYPLGAGSDSYVTWWTTGGGAAGNFALTIPGGLPIGNYEIRLMSRTRTTAACWKQWRAAGRSTWGRRAPAAWGSSSPS